MTAQEKMDLTKLVLKHGGHQPGEEMCVMEAVAFMAGEPWGDMPACACPVVANAARIINDRIADDDLRTEVLRPLLSKFIGSKAGRDVMVKRAFIAADYAVRVFAPIALEYLGEKLNKPVLIEGAAKLRGLVSIVDRTTALNARDVVREVRADAAAAPAACAAAAAAADAAAAYADAAAAAADAAAAAAVAAADAAAYAAA